jgi:hypothetical protein
MGSPFDVSGSGGVIDWLSGSGTTGWGWPSTWGRGDSSEAKGLGDGDGSGVSSGASSGIVFDSAGAGALGLAPVCLPMALLKYWKN